MYSNWQILRYVKIELTKCTHADFLFSNVKTELTKCTHAGFLFSKALIFYIFIQNSICTLYFLR